MGKTMLSGVMAGVLMMALAAGCQQQRGSAERMQSDALVEQLALALGESMRERRDAGGDLPEDYETQEFAESVLDSMLMQYPEVFTVTLAEERRLREGRLDDQANYAVAIHLLDQIRDYGGSLNTVTAYLAERLEAGELEGLQLELATRLLSAQLSTALVADDAI